MQFVPDSVCHMADAFHHRSHRHEEPIMGELMKRQKDEAKKQGYAAAGTTTATILASAILSPWFLVPGVPVSAYLAWRWLKYRGKWGMKV